MTSSAEQKQLARTQKLEALAAKKMERAEGVLKGLEDIRKTHLVRADQPMVLIAQPNRSGGTLLTQLFDGHPELHVHPWELEIGDGIETWPMVDLSGSAEDWFGKLQERHTGRAYTEGYSKDKASGRDGHNEQERFPFMLPPTIHKNLFLALAADWPVKTQRGVLDLYFTSYFNAWLDNQNLYGAEKRWVVGFRGRMRRPESLSQFFRDYPDGRQISILREAKGNVASRLKYRPKQDQDRAVRSAARSWNGAIDLQLAAKRRYGDRVFLITFEDLVTHTEDTMRALAAWLGIRFDPCLTEPTFNRMPIRASSHFRVERRGVLTEPLEHWRKVLTPEQAAVLDAETSGGYRRFSEHAAEDVARLGRARPEPCRSTHSEARASRDTRCMAEAAAWFEGAPGAEPPACLSPVVADFLRGLTGRLEAVGEAEVASKLEGSLGTANDGADNGRRWLAADWLTRTALPSWLATAGLSGAADALRRTPAINGESDLARVLPLLSAARRDALAAHLAARDELERDTREADGASPSAAREVAVAGSAAAAAFAAAAAHSAAHASADALAEVAAYAATDPAVFGVAVPRNLDKSRAAGPREAVEAAARHLDPTSLELQTSALALLDELIDFEAVDAT